MDDTPGNAAPPKRGRGLLWSFLAAVVAFGAGYGWQYYESMDIREQLAETRQELMVEQLRVRLGQAAIAAQAGDYESARQRMSAFFTQLDEVAPTLPDPMAGVSEAFLAMRDDVITGLSRANPRYAEVLYGMLDRFRNVAGLEEQMAPMPAASEPQPEPEPVSPEPDSQVQLDTMAEPVGG